MLLPLHSGTQFFFFLTTFFPPASAHPSSLSPSALGDSNKWFGGLHALDGMLILLLSLGIAVLGWRRVRSR